MKTEERKQIAIESRKRGYSCSQAVTCAFKDRYGIDESTLLKISEGFGGGIAGTKGVCGAVTAMVLLAGLENADGNTEKVTSKQDTYKIGSEFMDAFEEKNGSVICSKLKGLDGGEMLRSCNGCIEDPRMFPFEGTLYLTVACRAFPPGPYWEHDDPVQCMPDAVRASAAGFGRAVKENSTVTLLYRVDLGALRERCYDEAFSFVAPLHNPDISDDRDVVLFPRRLRIGGSDRIVCVHRPKHPWHYAIGKELSAPSIFFALGDSLADFADGSAQEFVFAKPEFPWEANRIGASWAPLEIEHGLWLLPYHGKQDDRVGYTQSFMLLRERTAGLPEILARPEERLLHASEPWELEGDFAIPCLFTCSGVLRTDGILLMGYGAADAKVGLVSVNWNELCRYLKQKGNIA